MTTPITPILQHQTHPYPSTNLLHRPWLRQQQDTADSKSQLNTLDADRPRKPPEAAREHTVEATPCASCRGKEKAAAAPCVTTPDPEVTRALFGANPQRHRFPLSRLCAPFQVVVSSFYVCLFLCPRSRHARPPCCSFASSCAT